MAAYSIHPQQKFIVACDSSPAWRILAAAVGLLASPGILRADAEADWDARAAAIHARLFILDGFVDTPTASLQRPGWDIGKGHEARTDYSQCDFPRMESGGLKAAVFAAFVAQGPRTPEGLAAARDRALRSFLSIRDAIAGHAAECALALAAEDGPRIAATGKRAIYLSLENGYGIGRDLTLLRTYYQFGMRFFLPVHIGNNDLGDSSIDPKGPEWNGLSPLGRAAVRECNRLGIVVDGSHASDAATEEMIALSQTPIILSHSGCKAVYHTARNVGDDLLRHLAAKGGVIQIDLISSILIALPVNPARNIGLQRLMIHYGSLAQLDDRHQSDLLRDRLKLQDRFPDQWASLDDFLRHLFHAIDVAGIDHVGIGSDMDNGGGVTEVEDVSAYPRITRALVRRGLSDENIAKIWGGNTLRVMRAAELYAAKERKTGG